MAKKSPAQLDREIATVLERSSHATKGGYDKDDARAFGRYACRMEQTKAKTLSNARAEGFRADQLSAVEDGWEAEKRDTIHGGYSSHATRRTTKVSAERKALELSRERLFQALGYAGNTPTQVREYHTAIDEIDAKLKSK